MEAHYNVMLRYFFTVLSFVSISTSAEPPFGGTIFIDPDIITESDPTTFVSIEAAGQDLRTMYDRRSGWIENNAFLFEANFSDSLSSQVQVNSEFETASAAAIEAEKYAIVIGRLPKALRVDVATYWIHKGVEPFGGGNNNLLIHVGQADLYVADGILEETFVHEAAHTSLDAYHASSAAWLTAQEADGEFISTYAEDNPTREDIAESFLPYLAVEFRADRISEDLAETITNTIPNRIAFFNSLDLDLAPITTTSVDSDGDGIGDGEDNCPEINNVDQLNSDSDELGNACDEDDDNDGLADTVDAFPLDFSEQLDTDEDGVGDNSDAFPTDATESADSDGDGTGDNADLDDDNDGYSDEQEVIDGTNPLNPFSCSQGCFSFDIDLDEKLEADALTDGLLVIRYLFGFSGDALISGATSNDATRQDATEITSYLNDAEPELDIDGDNKSDALTDGLLLIRYLFGFSGDALISGAVGENAQRTTAEQIDAYISERITVI